MTNGITMTTLIIESIVSRSTTKHYDPAVTLSDDQIRELVRVGLMTTSVVLCISQY